MLVDELTELDRRILQQLSHSPRASYRELGRSLGEPDHAVRRRYRAMQVDFGLRVTAREVRHTRRLDGWIVRIRAEPASVRLLARSLAARPDTRWVRSAAGETELVTGIRTDAELGDILTPLVDQLPALRRPLSIDAHLMLAELDPQLWTWLGDTRPAGSPEGPAEPDRAAPVGGSGDGGLTWTGFDDRLIGELGRDGRVTAAHLAISTGSHVSTVRRRVTQLMNTGLIEFDVDIDEGTVGMGITALLWLTIDAAALKAAAATIAGHDEAAFVAAITGASNLVVAVACADIGHLYRYLSDTLAATDGLRAVETVPVTRTFKRSAALSRRPARRTPDR